MTSQKAPPSHSSMNVSVVVVVVVGGGGPVRPLAKHVTATWPSANPRLRNRARATPRSRAQSVTGHVALPADPGWVCQCCAGDNGVRRNKVSPG